MKKLKFIAAFVALASAATLGLLQLQPNANAIKRDCTANSIVYCGVESASELKTKFQANSTGDLDNIYAHYGINSGNLTSGKLGQVTKSGNVVVDGKTVATGARSLGRNPMAGSAKVTIDGKTYYDRSTQTSFLSDTITAFVYFDGNGRFVAALLLACGNPVSGTPTKPAPKPAAVCQNMTMAKLSDGYRFTVTAGLSNGAKVSSYTFIATRDTQTAKKTQTSNVLDYKPTTPGTYKVQAYVNTTNAGSNITSAKCVQTFTIAAPKPAAACKSLSMAQTATDTRRFTAAATLKNGAKVSNYTFVVTRGGSQVAKVTQTSNVYNYKTTTPGSYKVQVYLNTTNAGSNLTSPDCAKTFTVPQPPVASCKSATVTTLARTKFTLNGAATTANGATVSQYIFRVYRGSTLIDTKTVNSSALTASTSYTQETPGTYTVKLTVKTSVGDKTGSNCEATFTVPKPKVPSDAITKLVENVKYKRVGVNIEYTYQIRVTNNGEVNLTNVKVTDTPEAGITLIKASVGTIVDNKWSTTVDKLAIGESKDFTITAKVPVYKAGMLTNTACVDAPEVPGTPEHCDTAKVDVPKDTRVCNPKTGEIIKVSEDDADKYVPVGSPECEDIDVCELKTKTTVTIKKADMDTSKYSTNPKDCESLPVELPKTGPVDTLSQLLGVLSLSGATAYYVASRRNS